MGVTFMSVSELVVFGYGVWKLVVMCDGGGGGGSSGGTLEDTFKECRELSARSSICGIAWQSSPTLGHT
jgi:hypothetical protein